MRKARGVFGLCAALGVAGLTVALAATVVALTRVDFALPTLSELASACERWAFPHGGLASWIVLALGSVGVAVLALTLRSALRQVRDGQRFERQLRVVGRLSVGARVRIVDDASPQAFCAGLVRPRIYLSAGALELLSEGEREAVLAHEAHHARRRDPLRLLLARALGDGVFFLPAVGRLAQRYAALAEVAADEAAARDMCGRRALASALLAFDAHPHPAVVGIAPERVDRLLGERSSWELPLMLLAGATATLSALGALTVRLLQATDHASITLPELLAQLCMVAMAIVPLLAGAGGLLGGRRLLRRSIEDPVT